MIRGLPRRLGVPGRISQDMRGWPLGRPSSCFRTGCHEGVRSCDSMDGARSDVSERSPHRQYSPPPTSWPPYVLKTAPRAGMVWTDIGLPREAQKTCWTTAGTGERDKHFAPPGNRSHPPQKIGPLPAISGRQAMCAGAPGATRTHNRRIRSPALYPLSYRGTRAIVGERRTKVNLRW